MSYYNIRVLLAITGASGTIYALKFLEILKRLNIETHIIISEAGEKVALLELGEGGRDRLLALASRVYDNKDLSAPPASGSTVWRSMVVLPCSMGTLSGVASGASRNLIQRACDCSLKEGRPLVLAIRETPISLVHIRNMLIAKEAGAVIMPCMPSFYAKPSTIDELAISFAARVVDVIGISIDGMEIDGVKCMKRWEEIKGSFD